MARKKSAVAKSQASRVDGASLGGPLEREDKILNSMANVSIILMATMMGAFTNVMMKVSDAMASGMVGALGGEEAGVKVDEEIKQGLPKVDEKMREMILDIRKDVYAQMAQKRKEIGSLLSDPVFDVGPKIIEKYDFKLPKVTQELDDEALASYLRLLACEDPGFVEMFKELTLWINSLPKPSEQMSVKSEKGAIGKRRQIKK